MKNFLLAVLVGLAVFGLLLSLSVPLSYGHENPEERKLEVPRQNSNKRKLEAPQENPQDPKQETRQENPQEPKPEKPSSD